MMSYTLFCRLCRNSNVNVNFTVLLTDCLLRACTFHLSIEYEFIAGHEIMPMLKFSINMLPHISHILDLLILIPIQDNLKMDPNTP